MPEYEIIDCHVHVFPTAKRGTAFQRALGVATPERTGTIDDLLTIKARSGISRINMLMWTPAWFLYQELVRRLPADPKSRSKEEATLRANLSQRCLDSNEWAIDMVRQHQGELTCFLGIDPVFMDKNTIESEIENKLSRGAKGIKMAPVHFDVNDERLIPVYEAAQRWRVPVLSYCSGRGFGQTENRDHHGHPRHFEGPLGAFPECNIILAHLGFGAEDEVARLSNKYPNLHTDTSARLHTIGKPEGWTRDEAVFWFRRIGVDRVLFGTNYPMCNPLELEYVEVMKALPLTETERHKIFSENFRRLIELD